VVSPTGTAQASAAVPAAELQRLTTELTRLVGPVAKVLIKRALPGAASAGGLWRSVALHIENGEERAAFLKQAPS
jgi:serine/threonine-protein kinase